MPVSARALRAGKAVIELSLLTKPVERGLRELQARVRGIGQSFTRLGTFGAFGGGGGFAGLRNLFVGSAATAGLLWPVKLAANMEIASAQLGVFVGGADNARAMLLELQEFSSVSMIPNQELATGVALLARFGISAEQVVQQTKALAVVAGGNTEEFQKLSLAFAQVASAGKLQGEELRQLKNTAFNPLREIAEHTGETMDQVRLRMEAGTVSFDEVAAALVRLVSKGGRLESFLGQIGGTLIGQLRKAFAQLVQAMIPLGDEVLGPITKFFSALNGVMPTFAKFLKANAHLYKWILLTLGGIAAFAVAFTTLGLSFTLVSIAATGFVALLSALYATLMAVVSLPGLITIGFTGLIASFLTTSVIGAQMVQSLAHWFGQLRSIAVDTFTAIGNALTGGDIQLAAEILWAGLNAIWLQGSMRLKTIWLDLKYSFIQSTVDMLLDAAEAWAYFVNQLQNLFEKLKYNLVDFSFNIGAAFEMAVSKPSEHAAILKLNEMAKRGNKLKTVPLDIRFTEGLRKLLPPAIEAMREEELKGLSTELDNAKKRLQDLSEKAKETAQQDPRDWFGPFKGAAAAGIAAAEASRMAGQAFFDTRLAQQMAGRGDPVALKQLEVQRKIENNTRRRMGLPVI